MSHITPSQQGTNWTFLSNYSHVLICLANDPKMTMREISVQVGVTERAVQRIIAELESAEVLTRTRDGRQNTYSINKDVPLRHSLESHCTIGDLLHALARSKQA